MKTLKQYSEELKQNIGNPNYLSELQGEASADYAFTSEEYTNIQIAKAKIWTDIKMKYTKDGELVDRDKPLSDGVTEQKWRTLEAGQKELKLKYRLKALEKIIASCKSVIYNQEREYSNL